MAKIKVPSSFQWLFWSVNVKSLDLKKDKEYIITQILNYGTEKELKWLFRIYPEEEIKKVIRNPRRGVWFRKVLNFWTTIYNVKLKKEIFERAIFR